MALKAIATRADVSTSTTVPRVMLYVNAHVTTLFIVADTPSCRTVCFIRTLMSAASTVVVVVLDVRSTCALATYATMIRGQTSPAATSTIVVVVCEYVDAAVPSIAHG